MQISTIGLDIAKNVFQVHGIDASEKVFVRKQLRRSQVLAFFKALPPCLVGMEACATAHYWARELTKHGHQVRLMPAKDVKAYVKRNKNDAADAEAICEAVRRPTMRFVQVKSAEQQGRLMQHRTRDLLMRQRTQVINALRAHMAELGIVAAQGREGIKELLTIIASEEDARLPVDAHASLVVLAGLWGVARCRRRCALFADCLRSRIADVLWTLLQQFLNLLLGQALNAANFHEQRQHAGLAPAPDRCAIYVEQFGQSADTIQPQRMGLMSFIA